VQSLTDNPTRFAPRAKLWLGDQPVTVAGSRAAGGYVYITLKGFADRTAVEPFRHAIIQVPESDLPALPEGEYYRFQLVGLEVSNRDGEPLGVVEEVLETGANDVYRIRTPDGGEMLIAALNDVVLSIDIKAKRMVVDPPAWR
jgi:16S rRNA processing protein RimM